MARAGAFWHRSGCLMPRRASKRMGDSAYVSVVVPTPRAVSAALWRAPELDRLIAPRIALLLHVIECGLEIAELSLGQLGPHPQRGHCGYVFPWCAVCRRIALALLFCNGGKDAVQLHHARRRRRLGERH